MGSSVDLVTAMAAASRDVNPATEIRLIAGGQPDAFVTAVAPHVDTAISAYPAVPGDARALAARLRSMGHRRVRGGIRAVGGLPADVVAAMIRGYRDEGVEGVNIYNYGLIPEYGLRAIGDALRAAA